MVISAQVRVASLTSLLPNVFCLVGRFFPVARQRHGRAALPSSRVVERGEIITQCINTTFGTARYK